MLVPNRSTIVALDLATGQRRYAVNLADRVEVRTHGEARGPFVLEGPGVLVAKSIGGSLVAFDPESGRERARRAFGAGAQASAGSTGAIAVRFTKGPRGAMELLDPSSLQPLAEFGSAWFNDEASVSAAFALGPNVVAYVDKWGLLGARGVLVIDLVSHREVHFERTGPIDTEFVPTLGPSAVFFASQEGALHRAPGGKIPAPQGQRFLAAAAAGQTVLAAVGDERTYARVVGLDATTLQVRYDCGWVQPTSPSATLMQRESARHFTLVQTMGFVIAADGSADGELRAFDVTTGSMLWRRPMNDVGPLLDWHPLGGCLVLRSALGVLVLDAASGALVVAYAP